MTLQFVREILNRKAMGYLPGSVPPTVLEHFILLSVSKWQTICLRSFQAAERLLKDHVMELCGEFFGRFESSGLLPELKYLLTD